MNSFPYGRASLSILVLAVMSGLWLMLHRPPAKTATLTMWTFAKAHAESYREAAKSFEAAHPGVTIDVQLVSADAVTTRLQAAFWSNLDVPDLVEVEITNAGSFFRGRMAGKMALMPFPAVRRGGRRTSTWGGTMLGITRKCPDQELAWQLAMHLYTNKSQLGDRFRITNILPALREAWTEQAFQEPRAYWSNQRLGASYAALAPQIPYQYTSPVIRAAKPKLGEALVDCVQYYTAHAEQGFDAFVRRRLQQSAREIRQMIARNPY